MATTDTARCAALLVSLFIPVGQIHAQTQAGVNAPGPGERGAEQAVPPPSVLGEGKPGGIIDDPDGYVNLRSEKTADSPIIAKVKKDEAFWFECQVTNEQRTEHEAWCKVKLASGVTGWMHYSRIKFYYTEKDLPKRPKDLGDELDQQAREQGVNYYKVTRAAARGDKRALKTFFTLHTDGAGAEEHVTSIMPVVIHLLGDDAFAEFLREQPRKFRENVSSGWELGIVYPFDPQEYFRQHFPRSAKLLFKDK